MSVKIVKNFCKKNSSESSFTSYEFFYDNLINEEKNLEIGWLPYS